MGQCNCENREHHFILTTTKSVQTLPPAIFYFDRKPNSGMEVFDGERSSYGHQIPQHLALGHNVPPDRYHRTYGA